MMSSPIEHSPCYYKPSSLAFLTPISLIHTSIAQIASLLPFSKNTNKEHCLQLQDSFDITKNIDASSRPVAIVTGSNTGVGFETASSLVEKGYDVILACRSRAKGEEAADRINHRFMNDGLKKDTAGKATFFYPLDLSNLESVRLFAKMFLNDGRFSSSGLNILVNNAGINTTGKSVQGHDMCFQTNFVGHYLLTTLLMPKLQEAENYHFGSSSNKNEKGRIVNLSSVMHHFQITPSNKEDDIHITKERWWERCISPDASSNTYSESKLAMILFTIELNKRFGMTGIRSISVNPGAVNSDIWRSIPAFLLKYIISPIFRLLFLTSKQGSYTSFVASIATNLPQEVIYLQPYTLFSWYRKKQQQQDWSYYSCPFPSFEMLGPFVGYAATDPRLPETKEEIEFACASLWNVCDKVVKPFTSLK